MITKPAIFITARLKSTRLPKKALELVGERPVIGQLIDRMKRVTEAEGLVLCTSRLKEDDPLEQLAAHEGIQCFRGDADDVLLRLAQAAETFSVETVLNVTADNPFVDGHWLDQLARFHRAGSYDYSHCQGLPLGTFGFAVQAAALKRACYFKAETDTEVWGPYFTGTGKFRCGVMAVEDPGVLWPELRLTVDTPEDLALVRRIHAELTRVTPSFSLAEIVAWCRNYPEAVATNAHIQQKPARPIRWREEKADGAAAPKELRADREI